MTLYDYFEQNYLTTALHADLQLFVTSLHHIDDMQLLLCDYCIENSLHFYHHLGDRLLVEWTGHSGWFSINWLLSNHPSSNQTTDKEEAVPTHPTVSITKF